MKIKLAFVFLTVLFFNFISCKKKTEPKIAPETSTVVDVEGNIYKTVKIGDQWWMSENLKVKKYNDGSLVTEVIENDNDTIWAQQTSGAFYYNAVNLSVLYNGFVVEDSRKIAPAGWHIPTDEEWKTLERTIGMNENEVEKTAWRGTIEAEKLIIKSSVGWPTQSLVFGTNESGFTAIPGGCRTFDGYKNLTGNMAFWWSTSTFNNELWYRYLDSQQKKVFRQHTYKNYGFNIRCVKD